MADIFEIPVITIAGVETTLSDYRGKVILIVNVASRCGLSPQYAQLEELQKTYRDRGFTVLGFPSNQFFQELGKNIDIAQYCSTTWGVTFPMFNKVKVNGRNRHPLYAELTRVKDSAGTAGNVKWNFEKFLVLPDGTMQRFRPTTVPTDPSIISVIEANLSR